MRVLLVAAALIVAVSAQSCPTPTSCPLGFTGRFCDVLLCDKKGTVKPPPFINGYGIDMAMMSTCSGSFALPVDSAVQDLFIIIDGANNNANPNATLVNAKGQDVTSMLQVSNDGKTYVGLLRNVASQGYGQYFVRVMASTACTYQAHANTSLTFSVGFVSGDRYQHNDMPASALTENTIGLMVGHLNGLLFPGAASAVEVYADGALAAGYSVKERFRCAYDLYAGPLICSTTGNWWFKLFGTDSNGYSFMRTDIMSCQGGGVTTTTATPPVTTPSMCMNGGYYDPTTKNCICDFFWTGDKCQTPVCLNGGTPSGSQCNCMANYNGTFCEFAQCTQMNQNAGPFTVNGRTITLVIQATDDMKEHLSFIQDYISELYYNFVQYEPNFIQSFIIATFDDNGGKLLTSTNDPHTLFETVWHLATTTSTVCKKKSMQALSAALDKVAPYSQIFVFTNSPPDASDGTLNLNVIDKLQDTKNQVFFMLPQPKSGYCSPYINASDDWQFYRDIAQFSGGQALQTTRGFAAFEIMRYVATSYMMQQIFVKPAPDCTSGSRTMYVPIDSHTSAFTVTVLGNTPAIQMFQPNGERWPMVPVVDDRSVVVQQAISTCPDGWEQRDNQCFSGIINAASWTDADATCKVMNSELVTVLNREKQFMLDLEAGIDFWIGLNDLQYFQSYVWSTNSKSQIPLGHRFVNWAPNEPSTDRNKRCVAVKHMNVNGTRRGVWYKRDCSDKLSYVCQRHSLDNDNYRLPPGLWRVDYLTQPDGNSYWGKSCMAYVNVQSDLQLFYGYTTKNDSQFNDFPTFEPNSKSSTNRFVGHLTNLNELARVDFVQWVDTNYMLIEAKRLHYRRNCAYELVSDTMRCPKNAFGTVVTGHDEKGYAFSRYDYGICIGA